MARSGLAQDFQTINVGQLDVENEPSAQDLIDVEQGRTAVPRDSTG
jgi:hypothetical protein